MQATDEQLKKIAIVLKCPLSSDEIKNQLISLTPDVLKLKQLSDSKRESTEKYNEYCNFANDMLIKHDIKNDPVNLIMFVKLMTEHGIMFHYCEIPHFEKLIEKYKPLLQKAREFELPTND